MKPDPNELTARERLDEMGLDLRDDIEWNFDTLFPKTSGFGFRAEIKNKHKLLKNIEAELAESLFPDEEVLYVAKGIQARFWEQFFMGIWASLINQTVFVLTNVRILLFNSDTRGRPKKSIWMLYYSEITRFSTRVLGGLIMLLRDGQQFVFTGFRGIDRKQMPQIFQSANETYSDLEFSPEVSQSRENVCNVCKAVVPKNVYRCENCGQEYWVPRDVAIRSLIFPSWGDFTLGHNMLGLLELSGYVFSWLVALALLGKSLDPAAFPLALIPVFLVHVIDPLLTLAIARKGLVLKKPRVSLMTLDATDVSTAEP